MDAKDDGKTCRYCQDWMRLWGAEYCFLTGKKEERCEKYQFSLILWELMNKKGK